MVFWPSMESALDKDYALLRVVTKSPNGMFLVSCIDIFCLYTSSASLSQSECDLDLFPAPGTGPLTVSAWQNIFPRYSPLAVFSLWNTFSALYVLPGLTITAGQTSGFSVILTRYVIKWSEKKNIFAQLRFKKTSIVFYFMCFLLVRLVRSSDYRFWLESRETWLSYNFSGRSIQLATVQRPCCHDDGERSIYFRSVVKTTCSPFKVTRKIIATIILREPNFSVMFLYRRSRRSFEYSNRTSVYLLHNSGKAVSPRPSQPCC